MSANSKIEWTDATWNPVEGCSMAKGSEAGGCLNCYAARTALRRPSSGLAVMRDSGPRWTGKVQLVESRLDAPLHWRKPKRIFVNSMSDLFHEALPDEAIDRVFAVMALCPQHTFQVLTKRPDRMMAYFSGEDSPYFYACTRIEKLAREMASSLGIDQHMEIGDWPLPNIWLGVSVENQETADVRIPLLLKTPAAKRFVSYEPALGPVDFDAISITVAPGFFGSPLGWHHRGLCHKEERLPFPTLDWIITGGESGPAARPAHPEWFRSTRDQCVAFGVRFFFKQWGEWVSVSEVAGAGRHYHFPDGAAVRRVGKKKAGALLDGREWKQFPEVSR